MESHFLLGFLIVFSLFSRSYGSKVSFSFSVNTFCSFILFVCVQGTFKVRRSILGTKGNPFKLCGCMYFCIANGSAILMMFTNRFSCTNFKKSRKYSTPLRRCQHCDTVLVQLLYKKYVSPKNLWIIKTFRYFFFKLNKEDQIKPCLKVLLKIMQNVEYQRTYKVILYYAYKLLATV